MPQLHHAIARITDKQQRATLLADVLELVSGPHGSGS
jgi:hypothetical protein